MALKSSLFDKLAAKIDRNVRIQGAIRRVNRLASEASLVVMDSVGESRKSVSVFFGKSLPLMWYNDSNFGDAISAFITGQLSGKEVFHVPYTTGRIHFQCTGSVLPVATSRSIVWGTGFGFNDDKFLSRPKAIHMVRGYYTAEMCRKLGVTDELAVGDPCYLMAHLYQPESTIKRYKFGIIPHYVDYELCKAIFKGREDVVVINLLNDDYLATIDLINSCVKCISSSLHGIIASHAYSIPCMHVTFSDRVVKTGVKQDPILGDGLKYKDYFSGVGIQEYSPIEIVHCDQISELDDAIPLFCGDKSIEKKMFDCCPFLHKKYK